MKKEQLKQLAKEIETIAKNAGKIIINKEKIEITEKSDASNIVTNMDIASQHYIIQECQKLIPNSSFYAEEEGMQELSEDYTWVIDPIDGTTNYAYDYQHSCISIALLYKKKGIIGVVYNPYLDECFVGIENLPSTCNGQVIHVSNYTMKYALVLFGTSPYNKNLADFTFDTAKKLFVHCRDLRRSGSAALDICYVACGRVDAFYEYQLSPWDYAAGKIIAENAGAKVCGLKGKEMAYHEPVGVLFANPNCFDEMKGLIDYE